MNVANATQAATTLTDLWQAGERQHPEQVAMIAAGRQVTYRQLGDRVRRIATGLSRQWGVQPGDIVALLAPNSIEFVISYFAIVHIGATVQPVDERVTPEEMAGVLNDAATRFLILHGSLSATFDQVQELGSGVEQVLGIGPDAAGSASA